MTRQEKLEMLQTEGRPGWMEKIMNTVRFMSKLFSLLPMFLPFLCLSFAKGIHLSSFSEGNQCLFIVKFQIYICLMIFHFTRSVIFHKSENDNHTIFFYKNLFIRT